VASTRRMPPDASPRKHLEIANYPPPFDGWGTHTRFVVEEIRRRGHECRVLKINEGRRIKSPEYVDVQNGLDYVRKVFRFLWRGYTVNVHVNAESPKGYWLALIAVLAARICRSRPTITFHGGVPQTYFPAPRGTLWRAKFRLLFSMAAGILCDSEDIRRAIMDYGVAGEKIGTASGFSAKNLHHTPVPLPDEAENFLRTHDPVFFCYVSFRPEYRLEVLREGMRLFRQAHPRAGFLWLGFPEKEMEAARAHVEGFPPDEREGLLLLGNLDHDLFVSLLLRATATLRTPACDGVSASVLESLALGIPVVASENGRRPGGVLTYAEMDAKDMVRALESLVADYADIRQQTRLTVTGDDVARTADWLLHGPHIAAQEEPARAAH
jgi:glycosyltransferase involved in cell wall biosynthesis